jgi:hypothetical protein
VKRPVMMRPAPTLATKPAGVTTTFTIGFNFILPDNNNQLHASISKYVKCEIKRRETHTKKDTKHGRVESGEDTVDITTKYIN